MSQRVSTLSPRLVLRDAPRAITFYREVFGAELTERFDSDGKVVHAGMRIGDSTFSVTEESPEWQSPGPASLGGSPVVLSLECADVDATFANAVAHGAVVIFPLADQFYGARGGRVADPFGHLWILTKTIEVLSDDEVQRRMDAWSKEQGA